MRRRPLAFTMIELLVVVGIIALLVALLLPTLANARKNATAVECMSQLRQMFAAQNFYADDNDGRYVISASEGGPRWEAQLEKYLPQRSGDRGRVYHCPALPAERPATLAEGSYGLNSCLTMPFWNAQRHRKMDAARIILMGDKDLNGDDFLRSHDGISFTRPLADTPRWTLWTQHSGARSYRHGKDRLANMVMADGHVESMTAAQLTHASGAWHQGREQYKTLISNTSCGCP